MIASLSGRLAAMGTDSAVIEVAGVGFRVAASTATLGALGAVGATVTLFTELLVREDSLTLVGFGSAGERDWFGLLLGIQGVGARVALAVLSACPPDELARAVLEGNAATIARANGVGPKLAARIDNELMGKAPALGPGAPPAAAAGSAGADAVAALTGLGFRGPEAARAVSEAERALGAGAALDALIAEALRRSARG